MSTSETTSQPISSEPQPVNLFGSAVAGGNAAQRKFTVDSLTQLSTVIQSAMRTEMMKMSDDIKKYVSESVSLISSTATDKKNTEQLIENIERMGIEFHQLIDRVGKIEGLADRVECVDEEQVKALEESNEDLTEAIKELNSKTNVLDQQVTMLAQFAIKHEEDCKKIQAEVRHLTNSIAAQPPRQRSNSTRRTKEVKFASTSPQIHFYDPSQNILANPFY